MEDESLFTKSKPKEISDGLQNFIDSMVEEIVLEGKPFDTQKKYLKKFSEKEGLDYNKLEADITTFIEILDSLKKAFSNLQVKLAKEKGKECHISEDTITKLITKANSSDKSISGAFLLINHKRVIIIIAFLLSVAISYIGFSAIKNVKTSEYSESFSSKIDSLNNNSPILLNIIALKELSVYKPIYVGPFCEGLAYVAESPFKKGFVDQKGEIIIPCKWEEVYSFSEGLAAVQDKNGKWGFINKRGELQIPCQWKRFIGTEGFSEGLACVRDDNDRWGYINKSGDLVISCKWKRNEGFHEGLAAVQDDNDKWGFIDKAGELVIPCMWKKAGNFSEGFSCVMDNEYKYGYINKEGEQIIPCVWDEASIFSEGLAPVREARGNGVDNGKFVMYGKNGYINKNGDLVISYKWKAAASFAEGLAPVEDNNDKWGFIDKTGELVIPCVWEDVREFSEGLAGVKDGNGKWGYIDKRSKLVEPCKWDWINQFSEGIAIVSDDKKNYYLLIKQ